MRSAGAWALFVVACLGAASPARAQVTPARLVWERAPGAEACIDAAAVAEGLNARLGAPLVGDRGEAVVIVAGSITPAEGGFRARLSVQRPGGEELGVREVESRETDCRRLDEALFVIAVLVLEPYRVELAERAAAAPPATESGGSGVEGDPGPPAAAPDPPVAGPPEAGGAGAEGGLAVEAPGTLPPEVVAPSPSSSLAIGRTVGLAAAVLPRALPPFALGLGGTVGWLRPRYGVELELSGTLPAEERARGGVGRARYAWVLLRGTGCGRLASSGAARVGACAGLHGGVLRASGQGFNAGSAVATRPLALVDASLRGRARLAARASLVADLGVAVPLVRDRLEYADADGGAVLHRLPAAVGRVALRLDLHFD